ncbi:MAG: hypothetical protein LQ342_003212 [Letrouitia transgressa]|nr:MAG: hypothetical protein LQ342_003212 [Letrouitia transgressa]
METKRPLTPPADFMDIDPNPPNIDLSNGHTVKNSSPGTAHLTVNSAQGTSVDESEMSSVNGVNGLAVKSNNIPPIHSQSGDQPPTGGLSMSQADPAEFPDGEAANQPSLNSNSVAAQQPTSDVRDQPQPITYEQSSEIKEQRQQEDLRRDPELANGLASQELPSSVNPPTPDESAQTQVESTGSFSSVHLASTTDPPHYSPVPALEAESSVAPAGPTPSSQPRMGSPSPPDVTDQSTLRQSPSALLSPTKVSRGREDEETDVGPATKRSKVEPELGAEEGSSVPEFKVPNLPDINTNVTASDLMDTPVESRLAITNPQKKFLSKVIQNIKRSKDAIQFLIPVDPVALNIPTYPEIITKPMDLKTLEENLKADQYPDVEAFKSDFQQIVTNTITFNGPDHPITQNAQRMKGSFDRQTVNLPGPEVADPNPSDKKSRKASFPSAPKVAPSRRESRSSLPGSARSPLTAGSPQTFALGPQGLPLIRRDSTKGDGRPKREIHPPAPRDLPYANQKPKKKKFQAELRFCSHIMGELAKPKYAALVQPFAVPVDPVALNIPDYHSVIKKPMDLRTVKEKLDNGQYENAKEFEADVRLIFQNCAKYNGADHPIRHMANELEAIFDSKLAEKRQWIEMNTAISGAQSPTSSDIEDYEEEDDEEEEEEEDPELVKLKQSIAMMSKQVEMLTHKKKSPPVAGKKQGKAGKPDKKVTKKAAAAPPVKQEKKASAKASSKREAYVTYEQKQDISQRINNLSQQKMATALKIIRDNMPNLKDVQDDELELDIDELSDETLRKLYNFVKKNSTRPGDTPRAKQASAPAPTAAPSRKKHKPMSKHEQERQIEQIKGNIAQFENPTPTAEDAPDPYKYPAHANDSSGEEDDTEESEEE